MIFIVFQVLYGYNDIATGNNNRLYLINGNQTQEYETI